MEQHILSILKESNTIIIPNLGALTITNQTTGEIMFMPYLKYDDGKLSNYIAEEEGISSDEAKTKITSFTENILNKLTTSGSASLPGIGTFSKGEDDIEFKHDSNAENTQTIIETSPQVPASETNEEIQNETPIEEVIEPVQEEQNETEIETRPETTPEDQTDITTEDKELDSELTTPSKEEQKAALKAEKEAKTKAESEAKAKAKAEKEAKIKAEKEAKAKAKAEKKNKKTLNEDSNSSKPKKKRGIVFWILILLVLILGAGGTYVGLNYEDVKDKLPFLSHEKHEEVSEEHDEVSEEHEESNDLENNEETTSTESSNETHKTRTHAKSENGAFYIILGTFNEEVNARGLAERLSMEGVNNANVIERDGRYSVIYNKFSTKDAALSELETARTKAKNAWIFSAH